MSNYILLDAAARSRLCYLIAQIEKPAEIPPAVFSHIAQGKAAAVDFVHMGALADAIPGLLDDLRAASLAHSREVYAP